MTHFTKKVFLNFNESDLIALLEAARLGLSDADCFDDIAEAMDLSDSVLISLREKLHEFMNRNF